MSTLNNDQTVVIFANSNAAFEKKKLSFIVIPSDGFKIRFG
jgi:hypothetical protein